MKIKDVSCTWPWQWWREEAGMAAVVGGQAGGGHGAYARCR
jgi:hypothetical protein